MNKTVLDAQITGTTTPVATPWLQLNGSTGHQTGIHLITTGTLAGAWAIKVSCSPTPDQDDIAEAADVTSGFQTPSDQPITSATGSPTQQFVQTTALDAGEFKIIFTPSSGTGKARVHRWFGD